MMQRTLEFITSWYNHAQPVTHLDFDQIGLSIKLLGVEGVVRGLEGTHLADRCILTKLE
jgi:hypothetical protein